MKTTYSYTFLLFLVLNTLVFNTTQAQTILLGPESFNTDVVVHGTSAPTNVWFAPEYYSPIDYNASGGCTGGYVGYSGSWNNYWMNFLRTPEVNCTGNDSVILSFDLSNSYSSTHTNDKVFFNMWAEGAYHDATSNQTIYFDTARDCEHFEVVFDLTPFTNKNIMFYLNTYCGYNDSQTYAVKFDNIQIESPLSTGLNASQRISGAVKVFPNPSKDVIFILFPNPENELLSIIIYNARGQEVRKCENISGTELRIENINWQTGLYIFRIQNKNKTIGHGKFTLQ